ncbi:hypothetical protein KUL156_33430 [Alteromonas sp. KUL156]|nr:hypothetical protein KUL154_34910 [Alteromonas sp. KUL154]GFE00751.1 hypothetical protein KUL156_33430 [Alteromonas sp. KUL156]
MKENIALEKTQQKDSCQKITTYSFTAHYNEISSKEQPSIITEPQGVRLHFLRFGLFDYNVDHKTSTYHSPDTQEFYNSIFLDQNKKPAIGKVVKEKEANNTTKNHNTQKVTIPLGEVVLENTIKLPKLENFYIARTPLRAGYVYMINEKNPKDDFKEFKVDEFGMFEEIEWERNKEDGKYLDIRKATGKKLMYKILQSNEQTYCLAYSPVQWSVKYVNEILTSAEKRAEQCTTKFVCKGLPKNKESKDAAVTHYKETSIVVPNNHPMAHKYKDILYSIAADEKQQEKSGDNELLEDLFITLTDPIGCVNDICFGVQREVTRLKSIVAALETGNTTENVFNHLYYKKSLTKHSEKHIKQHVYLHRLAQATYDFVYNDKKNIETYDSTDIPLYGIPSLGRILQKISTDKEGVKREKVEKILAVKERKEQREIINNYRNDLGNVMLADSYQKAKKNYSNSIVDVIEDGKELTLDHFIVLGEYPNIYDNHLDLNTVFKPNKDKWLNYINKTLEDKPEVFKSSVELLEKTIDIHNMARLSLVGKTSSVMRKMFKAYAKHGDFEPGYVSKKISGRISYFRNKGVPTFVFKPIAQFDEFLVKEGKELANKLNGVDVNLKRHKNSWHLEYEERMNLKTTEQFIKDGKVTINLKNLPKRFEAEAIRFNESGALAGIILVVESFFLMEAINKWDKNNKTESRQRIALAAIKLSAALGRLAKDTKTYDKLFRKEYASNLKILTSGLTIVSSFISVFKGSAKTYNSFVNRDYDAMLVNSGIVGLSGVFLAADISVAVVELGFSGFFALGFVPALLIGGGILLLVYLNQKYFTDTQLEAYFKNFPLSDYTLLPKYNELSYDYKQRLLGNIENAITGDPNKYQQFKDLEVAFVELSDLFFGMVIQREALVSHEEVERIINRHYNSKADIFSIFCNTFKANIFTTSVVQSPDDLDVKAWYYPYGIKTNGKRVEIDTFLFDFPKPDPYNFRKTQPIPKCTIEFQVPQAYRYYPNNNSYFYFGGHEYANAEILLAVRVINDVATNDYSPAPLKNKARYKFIHFTIAQQDMAIMVNTYKWLSYKTHFAPHKNNNTSVKPNILTHEQVVHKNTIFELEYLHHIHTYTPKNE